MSRFPHLQYAILDLLADHRQRTAAEVAEALDQPDYPARANIDMALQKLRLARMVYTQVPGVGTREEMWNYRIAPTGLALWGSLSLEKMLRKSHRRLFKTH